MKIAYISLEISDTLHDKINEHEYKTGEELEDIIIELLIERFK